MLPKKRQAIGLKRRVAYCLSTQASQPTPVAFLASPHLFPCFRNSENVIDGREEGSYSKGGFTYAKDQGAEPRGAVRE